MKASLVEGHLGNHTASHISQEIRWADIEMPADLCGWCGGGDCSVKVHGRQKVTVSCKKFTNLPSFSLSSSKKKTKLFPRVPIILFNAATVKILYGLITTFIIYNLETVAYIFRLTMHRY